MVEEVTFAPGSYTVWHSHPFGQLVVVTAGNGWLQSRGRPAVALSTGDAVWIEPGEEHWHGSTPETLLTHLIIQEHDDGVDAHFTCALADGSYPPVTARATENEGPTA
ncbi:cupin domain-containing protein [Leifsonia sp. AG29]|uniref:cupin domain-containing protein n=1 Tax=Leifsonia sp. AG29 TaxID=2598860 RepID=UPI0018EF3243|nr:cupin domain-containing protein [Leifsonia sp. AG29]